MLLLSIKNKAPATPTRVLDTTSAPSIGATSNSSASSSAAWRKRDAERQRRHSRGWIASPEQTNSRQQQQQQQAATPGSHASAQAIPIYGHPQGKSDRDVGRGTTSAVPPSQDYGNQGTVEPPPSSYGGRSSSGVGADAGAGGRSTGGTGVLGVLRADLERLNSYFEFHEQRQFSFQQRYGAVDLRALSRIDLHDVVEAVDVQVLQGIMTNATFANVRERDLPQFSDHAMVKLIKVLQYSVEYLMNVQNTLLSNLDVYTDDNTRLRHALEQEERAASITDHKYRGLRRFAKQQKRTLQLYEAMLVGGSAGTYEAATAVAQQRALLKREAKRASRYKEKEQQRNKNRKNNQKAPL